MSSGKTSRSSVAPVATTMAGLRFGAVEGRRAMRRLVKAVWPADTKKAPPIVWKTVGDVSGW